MATMDELKAHYEEVYKVTKRKIRKYDPVTHEELTDWIRAIRNATVEERKSDEEWKDDVQLIQYKRMSEFDLKLSNSTVCIRPEPEHEYEAWLDVIKLPLPIPTEKTYPAAEFLFVRPDEYALFDCVGRVRFFRNNYILTGNPGISKSWFQWKYILLCHRMDLYETLWLSTPSAREGYEPEPKKPKVEQSLPFIPQLIVRTISGRESYLFHVKVDTNVIYLDHEPKHLKFFTDENSAILWEPADSNQPVQYYEITARIIATVSPNNKLFKNFKKESAEVLYMPCPSELQLRLMGKLYREVVRVNEHFPSDQEIIRRVKEYGPFIRIVLCSSEQMRIDFQTEREGEISDKCTTTKLEQVLTCSQHIMEGIGKDSLIGLSHRLVRYVVDRDHRPADYDCRYMSYNSSSEDALLLIAKAIEGFKIEIIIKHLTAIDKKDMKVTDVLPVYLARLFISYAREGIQWHCRKMEQSENLQNYNVKFADVSKTAPKYISMKVNTLYYPTDPTFPLVDMYYVSEAGKLIGIQATSAKKHAKPVSTYEMFYQKIGTNPESTQLRLYYLILPSRKDLYVKDSYTDSQFWTGVGKGIDVKWKNKISFYALVPPTNFKANYKENS